MKVGNAGGFLRDDATAAKRLLAQQPDLDFLTLDYLAEVSLSIMAIQQQKDPALGYARDFIDVALSLEGSHAKIITNAGGLNPMGLAKALRKAGVQRKMGLVLGDDVRSHFPHKLTANAYLGAAPLVKALEMGAEIVITGRVADPSLTVAPCLYHFGWNTWDLIAQATVAGHLIECGTQATGGLFTDWLTLPGHRDIGFPFVEFAQDGTFVLTKPQGTGGRVDIPIVKEQLLYEIRDPGRYLSPDVTVSFLHLDLEEVVNGVRIQGAQGSPPPTTLKVSTTVHAGYKAEGTLLIIGANARQKAHEVGEMIVARSQPERHLIECTGDDTRCYVRVAAAGDDLEHFTHQFAPMVTCEPPGTTGYITGRPIIRPLFAYEPHTLDVSLVHPEVLCV